MIPSNMITPTSFVVQWSKPSSDPVCGPVQYIVTVSTGGRMINNSTVSQTNCTVTGLSPNTEYRVSVTAVNNGGNGIATNEEATTKNGGKCTYGSIKLCIIHPVHEIVA